MSGSGTADTARRRTGATTAPIPIRAASAPNPYRERGERGDDGYPQGPARITEFAARFSGAHGLPETLRRSAGGQRGEAQRGDQPRTDTDQSGADEDPGEARQHRTGQAAGGDQQPHAQPATRREPSVVQCSSGPRLDGRPRRRPAPTRRPRWRSCPARRLCPRRGRKPTPTDRAAVAAASADVGARKAGSARRRARPSTVCRTLGKGGTTGTATAAHTARSPFRPATCQDGGRARESATPEGRGDC